MSQTIQAIVNQDGKVELLELVTLDEPRRALVTILDDVAGDETALDAAYRQMAEDEERESEALEWAETTIGDVADEPR